MKDSYLEIHSAIPIRAVEIGSIDIIDG